MQCYFEEELIAPQKDKQNEIQVFKPEKNYEMKREKFISKHSIKLQFPYKRKEFIKKKMIAQSIRLPREIFLNYKHMIFGFIELEDFYQDFSDPFDRNLVSISPSLISIKSVERDLKRKEFHLMQETNGPSGISDFSQIQKHFAQFSLQEEYANLCFWLAQYQQYVNDQQIHLKQLKSLMHGPDATLTRADCELAKKQFLQFVEDYFKNYFSEDDCYVYGIFCTNFDWFDIQPVKSVISQALVSVFGMPLDSCEQIFMHSGQKSPGNPCGRERIERTTTMLKDVLTEFKEKTSTKVQTYDNIQLTLSNQQKIVYWDSRPQWASKTDFFFIVNAFEVSTDNLKLIIDARSNKEGRENLQSLSQCIVLEQTLQAEIFIEKYYKDSMSNSDHSTDNLINCIED